MWKLLIILFTLVLTSTNMFVMAQLHHHHNRRILHQLLSPTTQPTLPSPPTKQNFFPFFPSTPPPPPLTTTPLPTFPANISSLVLPKPSPSKPISPNLIVVVVSLSLLLTTLIAFAIVFLLYHRRHRYHHQCFIHKKSSSSTSLPLFPPNTDYHSEQKLNSPDYRPLSSTPSHNFWESYHDVKQEEVEVFFSPIGSPGNLKTTLTPSNSCTPTLEKKSGETHNLSPRVSNLSGEYKPAPSKESSLNLPKLKPLRWENVRGSSNRTVEWDKLKSTSFRLNEESIEKLFAMNSSNLTVPRSVHLPMNQENRVLDPKKSQKIAILLRALNVTTDEVHDALLEGNTDIVGAELLESLLRMAPTKEEEHKLQEYEDASPFKLGSAEKFLKAILDIPFAFKRVEAMLYIANFDSEVDHLKRSFETLELACEELRNSQMLTKLLEAILNTGNPMNIETNYRDTHAFKLDTLLKLVHIKGTDGKTTLLHFVVQQIIRSEGSRISTANHNPTTEKNPQSTFCDDVEFSKIGLEVVSGLSRELTNVKNAAAMDSNVLNSEVTKLALGITQIKGVVKLNEEFELKERFKNFLESMNSFLNKAEEEIIGIQARECVALLMVKEITKYLNGNSAHEEAHPFRIFTVICDFLSVLDQVCKEVGKINERNIVSSAPQFPMLVPPVFRGLSGRWECSSSSDDDDDESSSSP